MVNRQNSLGDLTDFAALNTQEYKVPFSECINKIMGTLSFRKLAGKTQVILSLTGPDIRTRLTHTIEVARIARDICNELGLNANLAEAIALAHDIGHTPFGHVGERTLREIMCGCDTLKDRVTDYDFENSGFKHNLQSVRVLIHGEPIFANNRSKDIWPYILWGALTHSKPSWTKPYDGMDDEILISSKHCNQVYACHFHQKKLCKRNIQHKVRRKDVKPNKDSDKVPDENVELENGKDEKRICKPWYCSILEIESDINAAESNIVIGETTSEYIEKEHFKDKYWDYVFCKRKCFLAKLWGFKIDEKPIYKEHPYLFDHPFPNSFYAKYLNDKFFRLNGKKSDVNCISLEAQIVSQADEIAQRQQDLEDGITKNLLSLDDAIKQVRELITPFKGKEYAENFGKEIKKTEHLGNALVEFYREILVRSTSLNMKQYGKLEGRKEKINIYSFLNILNSMGKYSKEKREQIKGEWIKEELKKKRSRRFNESNLHDSDINNQFDIDFKTAYLYLMAYDYLEGLLKTDEYIKSRDIFLNILSECLKCLREENNILNAELSALEEISEDIVSKGLNHSFDIYLEICDAIRLTDKLKEYIRKIFKSQSSDFFEAKKKKWKEKEDLLLRHLLALSSLYENNSHKNSFYSTIDLESTKIGNIPNKPFEKWKALLGYDADKVLKKIVGFIPTSDSKNIAKDKKYALDEFEEKQKNTILKSEIVEKNDGKASYLLKRLFKAYITNSHQMPDTGLKYILNFILEPENWKKLIESEEKAFRGILIRLRKTITNKAIAQAEIDEIMETDFMRTSKDTLETLKGGTSNEIEAAISDRIELYDYLKKVEESRTEIKATLFTEYEKDAKNAKKRLNDFRAVLDNPVLNATVKWNSALARGICDFIASLTDQEALNEYDRLYAGIMELV